MHKCDVVVLGAGVSGLSAARVLAPTGLRVALVEARDRAGGRILTHRDPNVSVPIELGAEFVHGRHPGLWALIDEAGLTTWELEGKPCFYENGRLHEFDFERHLETLEKLKDYRGPDVPFSVYLSRQDQSGDVWASSYVEGFNAADQSVIGVASLARQQDAEDAIEGTRIFRIKDGYDELPRFLLKSFVEAGGVFFNNLEAQRVRWQEGSVTIDCRTTSGSAEQITARAVIVALPLGVLQADRLRFDPHPEEVFLQLRRLAFGNVQRMTLVFDDCFWNRGQDQPISFLLSLHGMPPTWWTAAPLAVPVITGWVGGPKAENPRLADPSFIVETGLSTLAQLFPADAGSMSQRLRCTYTHNWRQDPYAGGAYSYVPAGALDAPHRLTQPVGNTLFFAGEHTDIEGHWGTVHGALNSGLRAARDVLDRSGSGARKTG